MENIRKACLNNVHNIRSVNSDRNFSYWICNTDNTNCEKYKIKTPQVLGKLCGEFISL